MSAFKIYKLHFTSPLHISDQRVDAGISRKTIHSDTLYAALTSCLAKIGCDIPADGDLDFTVSSLFPYYQEDEKGRPVYFLPLPMSATLPQIPVEKLKTVKKVQWVDSSLYGGLLVGESLFQSIDEGLELIQGSYMSKFSLPVDAKGSCEFVNSEVVQRVAISDRTGRDDAEPYFVDRVLFKNHAGLYFLALGDTTLLDRGLEILSVEGIGTDRNVGFGFFEYTVDTLEINLPEQADYLVSLSTFIPASEQQMRQVLSGDAVAYEFSRRGGWITTPPYATLRKNAIYAFMPGSVFHVPEEGNFDTLGKIVDLRPECGDLSPAHHVWRCGKSIMLPINK